MTSEYLFVNKCMCWTAY